MSVASGPDITSQIDWETAPRLAVGVSTDVALVRRVTHEQTLRGLRNGLEWRYAADREHVFTMLRDTKAHLVYFYCHGGMSGKVPYIQVGPPTERGITIDNLRYKHIIWDRPRPLVFINGCHTTALEPRVALEMVSGFVENAQASGVIGTEITVFEPLATEFAETCLGRFLDGMPIGEAVRAAARAAKGRQSARPGLRALGARQPAPSPRPEPGRGIPSRERPSIEPSEPTVADQPVRDGAVSR